MTVTDIIQEALEQLGVLAAGETASDVDLLSCLVSFKNMLRSLPGFGVGGGLDDVIVTASPYDAKVNERIRWDGVGTLVVNLPTVVDTFPPRSGDRVAVVNGVNQGVFVYITSKGDWLSIDGLALTSDTPLGADCDQALCDILAYRVARKFGAQITRELAEAKDIGERTINARFTPDMSQITDPPLWSYWNNWQGALS